MSSASPALLLGLLLLAGCSAQTPAFDWALSVGHSASGDSQKDTGRAVALDSAGGYFFVGTFDSSITIGSTTLTESKHLGTFVVKVSTSGSITWVKGLSSTGASSSNTVTAEAAVSDGSGGVLIAGQFLGTVAFGSTSLTASSYGGFVFHMDSNGDISWALHQVPAARLPPLPSPTVPYRPLPSLPSLPLSTCLSRPPLLSLRVSPPPRRTQAGARAYAACSDGSAGALVAGTYSGTLTLGPSTLTTSSPVSSVYVMRVASGGSISWAVGTQGTSSAREYVRGLESDGAGGAILVGGMQGSVTCGATTLSGRAAKMDVFAMRVSSSGGITFALIAGAASGSDPAPISRQLTSDGSGGAIIVGVLACSLLLTHSPPLSLTSSCSPHPLLRLAYSHHRRVHDHQLLRLDIPHQLRQQRRLRDARHKRRGRRLGDQGGLACALPR